MPAATPFFAAFGPLLFGRPPRSLRDQLSAKLLLQADSISGLREAFGPMIPDEIVRGTARSEYDLKVYSSRPKLNWNPYMTVEYENQFYQMFREEPGHAGGLLQTVR